MKKKQNPTTDFPPRPFSYLEHVFIASKNTVMAEVVKLLKDLSEKFDMLREDVDSLKEHAGKHNNHNCLLLVSANN